MQKWPTNGALGLKFNYLEKIMWTFRRDLKKNISEESVRIFSDHPHADGSIEQLYNGIASNIDAAIYHPNLLFNQTFDFANKIIVDAGCGSGRKTIPVAKRKARLVIGIDGSAPAIQRAIAVSNKFGLSNIKYVNGMIEDIPQILESMAIEKVDLVQNIFNIHHVEDWRGVLSIFEKIIADGGYLYINWVDPWMGWGDFILKNKFTYHLGCTPRGRLILGKFLFGWYDKRRKPEDIDWDSFYADRYSAFYRWISVGSMKRELKKLNFEIIEGIPAINSADWTRQAVDTPRNEKLKNILSKSKYARSIFYILLRFRQYFSKAETRALICRKVSSHKNQAASPCSGPKP
jgi:SAM-dependent methyltransferase